MVDRAEIRPKICLVCYKIKPTWRMKYLTCSKKCSNQWNTFHSGDRNKRKKYLSEKDASKND